MIFRIEVISGRWWSGMQKWKSRQGSGENVDEKIPITQDYVMWHHFIHSRSNSIDAMTLSSCLYLYVHVQCCTVHPPWCAIIE